MSASSNASGHSALLNSLADHNTVLLELFGEDGVEEGVAAAVERKDEHSEDLGALQREISWSPDAAVTAKKAIGNQQIKSVKTSSAILFAILLSLLFQACDPLMAQYIFR